MKTIEEIRRDNLRFAEKEVGGRPILCDRIGKDEKYVSQLIGKTPTSNIGNKVAREIEQKLGYETGWMDHTHTAGCIEEPRATYILDEGSNETISIDDITIIRSILDYAEQVMDEMGVDMEEQELCEFTREMLEMWRSRKNPIQYDNVRDLFEYRMRIKNEPGKNNKTGS